jgi:tetratricopeptide (TPR) repeat protein
MSSPARITRKTDPTSKDSSPEEADLSPYLKWAAPATAVILLLSAGFFWMRSQEQQERLAAYQDYADASSRAEGESATDQALRLVEMAKAHIGTPEAALALIQAGSLFYNEGDYEAALDAYERMQAAYAGHELAENAAWGALHCKEELGDLEAALAGYRAVQADEVLHPRALLASARVLEKQQDWSGALSVYEQVLESYPDTAWSLQAEMFSQRAKREQTADTAPAGN